MSGKKPCSICGKPAKVFVSLIKTGHSSHSAYCEHHAEELGLFSDGAFALLESKANTFTKSGGSTGCPACGFGLLDWKRTGRFGCPECYDSFAEKIIPALIRLHADTVHRGKIPRKRVSPALLENRIQELQAKLESAVKEERFEDAAATRDEMSELRSSQQNLM